MAEIKISELRPAGTELLEDAESFINELGEREVDDILGGGGHRGGAKLDNDQFTYNINNQQYTSNYAVTFDN